MKSVAESWPSNWELPLRPNGTSGASPEMALRLSKALGRTPERWLTMQDNYDPWQAKQTVDLEKVQKIEFQHS
jgi:plasmid maintenance system antidote protein VapI